MSAWLNSLFASPKSPCVTCAHVGDPECPEFPKDCKAYRPADKEGSDA